ncbi:MAG: hypothetical protein M3Q98_16395 [Actinomycetota bacterium]|nr:hypothetical protein [Actinomycetota bacterium]
MTRVDEFNSFYSATSAQALQVTYAVCGDRQVAHEATIDAYRRAWRDWSKIRNHNPLGYVRTEAWKLTALSRGTHPLRRKHEDDSDTELLEALGSLSSDDRRLIALMTLGDIDLEEASHEVGLPAEEGIENVTTALSKLEQKLGQSIDQIERRMHDLNTITTTLEMPPAAKVRTLAKRGRQRNTVALVAAAIAFIVLGGFAITDGESLARSAELPSREKIGAERPDQVLMAQKLDDSNLLSVAQVKKLDPESKWKIVSTDKDVDNKMPYATCPTKRFADPDPLRVFVRTYDTGKLDHERLAQAIEVSRSDEDAEDAYKRLVRWYSNCEHPRVQLVDSYTVKRPFGDFQIMRLRSHRFPERTFTVGLSHSGTVTSTLVHEVDSSKGPSIEEFARTLNTSVSRLCVDSGGTCTNDIQVLRANPPVTDKAPSFLGIVDLPPVASVDKVWAGTDPVETKKNPAATLCDKADFTGKGVAYANSRVFLIPEAKELPQEFGVAETTARFDSDEEAKKFVDNVGKTVEKCPKANLSASLDQRKTIKTDTTSGKAWRVGFEVDKKAKIYYRMALIRRDRDVAQVTFTSADKFDISRKEFEQLVERSGQRLIYMQ